MSSLNLLKVFLLFFCFPHIGIGQQSLRLPKQEQIHQLFRYYEDERQFNGNILIAEKGKVVYENAIGWANKDASVGLNLATPFYLASISKSFTAIAIIQLEEKGKIDYDQKIDEFFPEMGSYGSKISIRNLLNHTSGLPDYFTMEWDETGVTNAQIYNKVLQNMRNLEFRPGYKYSYNNTGYILLALIVEKASGLDFYEYIEKHICEPIGLENTWVHDLRNPGILQKNRAIGYNFNMKKEDDYDLLTWGDGGMYSTLEDLFIFDRALYDGSLISSQSLIVAYSPVLLAGGNTRNYGFGWVIGSNINGKVVSHTGGLAGFRNYFERQIEVENTIIILTNNSNRDINNIRNTLVKILDGRPYTLPDAK